MTGSRCTELEREIVRLLAGEVADEERSAVLERSEMHARGCAECRGALDLLAVAALPACERAADDDPGEEYWRQFNHRLSQRIAEEPPSLTAPRPVRPWMRGELVAAVVVASLAVLVWILWPGRPDGSGSRTPSTEVVASQEEIDSYVTGSPDEVLREVELFPGAGESWDLDWQGPSAGLDFPQVEELSPEARQELLEWLRSESAAGATS